MIGDLVLDWLQSFAMAVVGLLPEATVQEGSVMDSLTGLAAESTSIVDGGPGVLVNMALLTAMVASWLLVDAGILIVRTIIWVKKVILF